MSNSTLVLGCSKADDGSFENHAIGNVYWCKVWFEDLGDDVCKKLAGWTHEKIDFEVCGFKRYYLGDNPSKRCSISLLATNLLDRTKEYNSSNTNNGGWKESKLNEFLNSRFYNAVPDKMKSLIKRVTISSSIGNKSTDVTSSNCYIYIPSVIEVCNTNEYNIEPYTNEGSIISYMISNDMRKRAYHDGSYASYWLRSPSKDNQYMLTVDSSGSVYGFTVASNKLGILIGISF